MKYPGAMEAGGRHGINFPGRIRYSRGFSIRPAGQPLEPTLR